MPNLRLVFVLSLALLVPHVAPAQVISSATQAPEATAAGAGWAARDQPIVVQGLVYVPTRETRMFDGLVMAQVDVYEGVPIYADVTREPFTLVYVPMSRSSLRTYERGGDSEIAVTSGRGTPIPAVMAAAIGSDYDIDLRPAPGSPLRNTRVESIPAPRANGGVWIPFNGTRWYSDGPAVSHLRGRFVQVGAYYGFPVFREIGASPDRIWIPAVIDGPLAPYVRR